VPLTVDCDLVDIVVSPRLPPEVRECDIIIVWEIGNGYLFQAEFDVLRGARAESIDPQESDLGLGIHPWVLEIYFVRMVHVAGWKIGTKIHGLSERRAYKIGHLARYS
jgi:hypothetical protein